MPRYEKHSKITLQGDERLLESILKALVKYPADKVVSFFRDLNINFPRELRMNTLKVVFRDEVFATRQERHTLADEMNYRLSWFNQYTEVQLLNLFKFYNKRELEEAYLELLWLNIIENITDKKIAEKQFVQLIKLAEDNLAKNANVVHNIESYNNTLNDLFFDKPNYIDGLTQEEIRPVLYRSSTITEIRQLGKKYGVNVPTRLKKSELIDIMVKELKDRNEYTPEVEAELNNMNIVLLQRYARNNDIKASTELKKEEVIEYILANAKETKEAYYIPSPTVYQEVVEEAEEVAPAPVVEEVEEVAPAPVVEEVEEEPTPEPVVEEVIVRERYVQEDLRNVVIDQITVKQVAIEKVTFDTSSVVKTEINTVEFHGTKPRQFRDALEVDEPEEVQNEGLVLNNENLEVVAVDDKKKMNGFLKFLLILLTILALVVLVLIIYAFFTPNQVPAALEDIENALPGFLRSFLEFFRDLSRNILN